jgi:serine/threonine-protein kinase
MGATDATTLAGRPADPARPGSSADGGRTGSRSRTAALSGSRPADGLFAPGTLLADRYQIRTQLGAGAMGEVYLADDLTLDQRVALKFLPAEFGQDDDRRQRFLQEVRLARQVSHPNLCRVYDVGEVDGHLFLSMEYVTGRDLASVLRSIGRFPQEKGLDLARQLCAGLAALHDRGILHRDLKPANVMLDDDGRLRITDFGLAGVADRIAAADVRSGTPLYMAPEQLAAEEVTERSDIYALGLVLHEIFSGKRAFDAETIPQLQDLQRSGTRSRISDLVTDLDPAVERVINRCLEPDPARRPPSALVVSTALPGGDPLAAALAMGETPSAALVAAAGGKGGIHPVLGLALLLISLAGIALMAGVGAPQNLVQHLDLDRSADALEERARQLVADLGHDARPVDRSRSFSHAWGQLGWLAAQDSTASRWDDLNELDPVPLRFWYRQAPTYLLTRDPSSPVTPSDPPATMAGMVEVVLDAHGRLLAFEAVPPETRAVADTSDTSGDPAIDPAVWARLFAAAQLDQADFAPVAPSWVPDVYADELHAWAGTVPGRGGDLELTVEAATTGGKVVSFLVRGPWSGPRRTVATRPSAGGGDTFILLLVLGVLAAAVTLALRNHRKRRTDLRGAGLLALVLLVMPTIHWLFGLHHAPLPNALLDRFFHAIGMGGLYALLCMLLYLAIEPQVRRIWPEVMIGWSRLIAGGWRDPMVGRSVLIGGAMFGLSAILITAQLAIAEAFGMPPGMPGPVDYTALATPRALVGNIASLVPVSVFNALFFLMLLVLLRLALRKPWAAYVAFAIVTSGIILSNSPDWRIGLLVGPLLGAIWAAALVRGGLLPFLVGFFLWVIMQRHPLTLDSSQMYAASSLTMLASIIVVLAIGYSVALAGRSLLRDEPG